MTGFKNLMAELYNDYFSNDELSEKLGDGKINISIKEGSIKKKSIYIS